MSSTFPRPHPATSSLATPELVRAARRLPPWFGIFLALLLFLSTSLVQASTIDTHVTIDVNTVINPDAQRLLGTTFDARSSMQQKRTPAGYYSPVDGSLLPGVAPLWNQLTLSTLRYPGNAIQKDYNFKPTIGPVASRPQVDWGAGPQQVIFGFDEFMAMTTSRGVDSTQIQLMVSLYTTYGGLTPAQNAADWVEYANGVYDPNGQNNPNGGTDWAAVRAANGHPLPYGVKIWNIGNEPWGQAEMNLDVAQYVTVAADFIAQMKAVDPSIRITLAAAGAPTMPTPSGQQKRALMTAWDTTLLSTFGDDIYGLSQHFFYDGSACRGVGAVQQALELLAQQIAASGKPVRLLVGDQAHSITPQASACTQPNNADFAMQWQGAVRTADFLMMAANEPAVERANFWIWGMPSAVWHPIRRNADGSYTMLAVGQLYAQLPSLLLGHGVSAAVTSPASADGNSYSVRAGAFRSVDKQRLTVVVVNRDAGVSHTADIAGVDGYSLASARLLTGASPNADNYSSADLAAASEYTLPGLSILVLEYQLPVTATSNSALWLPTVVAGG